MANNTGIDIPSAGQSTGTVTSSIEIDEAAASIWAVNVKTRIKHTSNAHLDITLTSPAGTSVVLSTDNGSVWDNLFDGTIWHDQADVPVTDTALTDGVPIRALVPEGVLGTLRGQNPNGTWTLSVTDDTAGETGRLEGWELTVTSIPVPFSTKPASVVRPGAAIPTGLGLVSEGTFSGLTPYLSSLIVTTKITHPVPGQLELFLTSPAGTTVTLSTRNGGNNDGAFSNIVWFDSNPGSVAGDRRGLLGS